MIAEFRNSYNPRIAVTVDMIATGTDVSPLECVFFMRSVKSRTYFEQMKGRGVRVINDADFQAVTPDAPAKEPVRHRRRGRRHRDRPQRHAAARPQADGPARQAASSRSPSAAATRRRLDDRRPARPARPPADQGGPGGARRSSPAVARSQEIARGDRRGPRPRPAARSRPSSDRQGRARPSTEIAGDGEAAARRGRRAARDEPGAARATSSRCAAPTSRRSTRPRRTRCIDAGYSKDATDRARETVESFERSSRSTRTRSPRSRSSTAGPTSSGSTFSGDQGARARDRPAALPVDAREALGGIRGARRAPRCAAPGGACSPTSSRSCASRSTRTTNSFRTPSRSTSASALGCSQQENAGRTFTAEQLAWLERIRDHIAASLGDHGGRLRLHAVRRARRPRQGVRGVRRRTRAASRRAQ